jgi:hypothetical protein
MPSIQTLIGERFEKFLMEKYPSLKYTKDKENVIPDFYHPLFYAEAKTHCHLHGFAAHLKTYQIESFRIIEEEKPVIYALGVHNFEDATNRLAGLSTEKRREILAKEMDILRLYIVDNEIITNIWRRRNCLCKRGHIHDCTLRERNLVQIINNDLTKIDGKEYRARDYYNISDKFSFALPFSKKNKNFEVGYIMPLKLEKITDFFYRQA